MGWRSAAGVRRLGSTGRPETAHPQVMAGFRDQLWRPTLSKVSAPVTSRVFVNGAVLTSGIRIEVVNAATGQRLGRSGYSQYQGGFSTQAMVVPFAVAAPAHVRVLVASWTPFANSYAWVMKRVAW